MIKPNLIHKPFALLAAASFMVTTAWGGSAKLLSDYQRSLDELKQKLNEAIPKPDQQKISAFDEAFQAEIAAEAVLSERKSAVKNAKSDMPAAEKAYEQAKKEYAEAQNRSSQAMQAMGISEFLAQDQYDAQFAKFLILSEATPSKLASFASRGTRQRDMVDRVLSDDKMLIQIAVADGPKDGNYIRAIEILQQIEEASPKAKEEGPLKRLALAIALEHATPIAQRNAVADSKSPTTVDPIGRYLQFEQAFLDNELDPAFANLTVWDMRMVVDGEESDEISRWGREMLRNYRPDHITATDYGWRYVAIVRSDIPYGSQYVKNDRDDLQFFQNILMNGGICGRRAFIGRFLLRSFGMPTIARPQKGHAALAHRTPNGWVINLGAGWGHGWTRTAYRDDLDFLATTQARALGGHFLKVKRARWIGDLLGEKRVWGYRDQNKPEFWNKIALITQSQLIEAANSQTLGPLGEDIAEATETKEHYEIPEVEIAAHERHIRTEDGVIRIPAAATSNPTSNSNGIQFMDSFHGGTQLHYSRSAKNPTFEYAFQSPSSGKFALIGRVATASWRQGFEVTVNGGSTIKMPLPHTVGIWQATEPVEIDLRNGRNSIEFKRYSEDYVSGISIREFILVPWQMRNSVAIWENEESAPQEATIPLAHRRLLGTSLLRDLVKIGSNGGFQSLPLKLSISNSQVHLVNACGSSVLAFQAPNSEQTARIALDDLTVEDQALLARFVARHRPDDADANALAASYMDATEQSAAAEDYRAKAGTEALKRFADMLANAAN